MKRSNKKITLGIMVLALSSLSIATFAATAYNTPAGTLASITGEKEETVLAKRQAGMTYGQIASEKGVLADFQAKNLERKKELLSLQVKEGVLTQAEADEILANMKNRQTDCLTNGTPTGKNTGCSLGKGKNGGMGMGKNCGMGGCN